MREAKNHVALFIGGGLIAVSLLFPPWASTYQTQGISQVRRPAGYGFLLAPPSPQSNSNRYGITVDWSRLAAQIGVIALLVGGAWFATRHLGPSEDAD